MTALKSARKAGSARWLCDTLRSTSTWNLFSGEWVGPAIVQALKFDAARVLARAARSLLEAKSR
jgi:hypothetical protein